LACDDKQLAREPTQPPRPAAKAPDRERAPLDDASLQAREAGVGLDGTQARRAVARLRTEELEIPRRRVTDQRLALGSEYLGLLDRSHLIVRETKHWTEKARLPVEGARQVIALQDGSLLAVGSKATYHWERRAKAPSVHPHVPLFAESVLYADRRRYTGFGVVHAFDARLYRYDLEDEGRGLLPIRQRVDLVDFDGQAFVALNDGSFMYTAGPELHRFFAEGKRFQGAAPTHGGDVWRLLPAPRLDQVWLALENGAIELIQLGTRFRRVRSLTLPGSVFDVVSNARYLAALRLEQASMQPRQWWLTVINSTGKQLLNVKLPMDRATADDDWVARFTENKQIALSRTEPIVAVGGPAWLGIWSIQSGKALLTHASEPGSEPVADGGATSER
jgi:hypothetical protein